MKTITPCDCIVKAEKALKKETGDKEAYIKINCSFKNKIEMFIPIAVRYHQKKKDGTLGRWVNKNMMGSYCPFCGKKIMGE